MILGNSFWALQIFIDRVLLGRAGDQVEAALALTALLFWTPMCLFQNTARITRPRSSPSTPGLIGRARVGPVVWQSLYFSLFGGLVFMAMAPLASQLLAIVGHSIHIQAAEAVYFRCLCYAAPPSLLTASALSFFAGRGDTHCSRRQHRRAGGQWGMRARF